MAKPPPPTPQIIELPFDVPDEEGVSPLVYLKLLADGGGAHIPADPAKRETAQRLAYKAMELLEAGKFQKAVEMCGNAFLTYPFCVEALLLTTEILSVTKPGNRLPCLRGVIRAAELDLGEEFIRENTGHFWLIPETRPYMEALAMLAQEQPAVGDKQATKATIQHMLKLNPNDNQGIRYGLASLLLELGEWDGFNDIRGKYDEDSPVFSWGELLVAVVEGKAEVLARKLAQARKINKHLEAYLTGRKKLPKNAPPYYQMGSQEEAASFTPMLLLAWQAHPGALAWLKAVGGKKTGEPQTP